MEKFPYRYKFYYKDGTTELSGCSSLDPLELYNDFDGLMDWDEFDNLSAKNMTTKEILEMAMEVYKSLYGDYYRIDIINDETNEIVDSLEKSIK